MVTEEHGKNTMLEEELSYKVRGCVFEVYRELGPGYLEKVYERALLKELKLQGLNAEAQVPMNVRYKGEIVGEYFTDIMVENTMILELKAQMELPRACEAQLLNYLKAGNIRIGLLVNFHFPKATIKRLVI